MSNYTNAEIYQAVTVLKSQGLSNQDIQKEAEQLFDFSQQLYVENILQELDFGSKIIRSVKNYDNDYLFEIIYQAVISGTDYNQIIDVCSEELNLEDLAFSKLALEYVLINRYISKYERDAFIIELYKQYQESKSYQDLVKLADSTKNIYLKQLVYKTAELVAKKTGETPSLSLPTTKTNTNYGNLTSNTEQEIAEVEEKFNHKVGDALA